MFKIGSLLLKCGCTGKLGIVGRLDRDGLADLIFVIEGEGEEDIEGEGKREVDIVGE